MDYSSENQRARTWDAYNLRVVGLGQCGGDFDMPRLWGESGKPTRLVGFNYARTLAKESADAGIHFFLDDYQFERVWRQPEAYTETLRRFSCVLTPDFSTYSDMPMPMQMWNVYRSRAVGRYWQDQGITVIPTLQWAEPSSYAYCLTELPEGATVAVSTVGVRKDPMAVALWRRGTGGVRVSRRRAGC